MYERPRLKMVTEKQDKILNRLSLIFLLLTIAFTLWLYITSPEKIPAHFDDNGNVNRYDNKLILFFLPMLATGVYFLLRFFSNRPHLHNYPSDLTADNAPEMYKNSSRVLRLLNVFIMAVILFLQILWYMEIKHSKLSLNGWWLSVIICLGINIPLAILIYTQYKKQKSIEKF